jgi:hypothetical protein
LGRSALALLVRDRITRRDAMLEVVEGIEGSKRAR